MKINQVKAGVILSYLQTALNAVISLVYTPIMLRLLGQSEYGVYTLASSMIAYLGLLNFGLSSSYIRYYSKYKSRDDSRGLAQLNSIFLSVYTVIALIAFAAGLGISFNTEALFGATLTAEELVTTKYLMLILSFNLMMTFFSTVFTAYVGANERFVFQKVLSMGKTVVSPLVTIPVLLLGYRSIGMAVVTTVISLAVDVSNIVYCFRKLNMKFSFRGADFRIILEIASFSVFIAINSIVDQINWQVDKFILGRYQGSTATAVYGVASQINTLYMNVSTSVSSVFTPRVHRLLYAEDSSRQYSLLFTKIGRIQMLLLGLVGSGLILFGRPFIQIWAGRGYEDAYAIMLLLVLPCTIPLIQNLGIEIQRAMNMHRFRTVAYGIMAGVNLCISVPLGKLYGGIGCAAGTSISLLAANGFLMNWYYSAKMGLNIRYFWKEILRMIPAILLASAVGVAITWMFDPKNIFVLALCGVLYSAAYALFCWGLAMNREEKQLVLSFIKKAARR
ncbi:oligosaccharide flippase family protein [Butyricicoccus sp.]|uniref:oligosaccharide flippase family protein n=1 Tax=Butyricicoccus sp. TaxID=2049021 RepID=UPI003F18D244